VPHQLKQQIFLLPSRDGVVAVMEMAVVEELLPAAGEARAVMAATSPENDFSSEW